MMGVGSLGEFSQIGLANALGIKGGLLGNMAVAHNALAALGLPGPLSGLAPYNLAYNVMFANMTNATLSQLSGTSAAASIMALGTSALLANSGRLFLNSTYYGSV